MRVLVVAHTLDLGGTQTNAIELAHEMGRRGLADIVFAASPGPAEAWARDRGLDLRLLPPAERHPSAARARALDQLAREVRPDLVHVWDWPQCFDAYPGLHLRQHLPMLCTVMGMVVPRFIPRHLPTTFGTVELAERARTSRLGPVHLLEPPVDRAANRPGLVDGQGFRVSHGISDDELLITMVCRLESWLKMESLQRGIAAVDELAERYPVRLVIAGTGSARDAVAERAEQVCRRHGRAVVQLAGALMDPRPAYAAADLMLGMGGSALRSMAFGKPLVVVGEQGFSRVLDEDSVQTFLHQGWYGLGSGAYDDLPGQVERLLLDAPLRQSLGTLGERIVAEHYDLGVAAEQLGEWYREVAAAPVPAVRAVTEAGRSAAIVGGRRAQQTIKTRINRTLKRTA
ncbi:glycosyltransferase family 4 protein [Pedococcus bigeumensis]|uniref:D-inositol 3-phosphate glycosyltransferase n=1 Tax=Pedococcus bigeumensis TaxID=433644 RepID=A0A502CMJ5_9MICO|nr:glycosyltransferase family 4 protein [Pedococcus bigeumensis]TPG13844.1 glycosyltransferase [Pedococcus bigeumensis]